MAGNEPAAPAGPNGQMEKRIRDTMEQSFGRDLSGVRVHTGGQASDAARSMGAQAFATGNNVAFRSSPTVHTAAHELTHVVQQRAGAKSAATILADELARGSTPPHEGRVVVMAPHVTATVAQSLGAAHVTVKNLANIERQGVLPPSGGSP